MPPLLTIVVPTYNERANISALLDAIAAVPDMQDFEVLFVDDQSPDGTAAAVRDAAGSYRFPVRVVVREGQRGLGPSVCDGIRASEAAYVAVIDADLSHPPSVLPALLAVVKHSPADAAIGSRYSSGGSTDEQWPWYRLLFSRLATLAAQPLAATSDPMSGYFLFRRSKVDLTHVHPRGFKIGLEIVTRNRLKTADVPIHFGQRFAGESKLSGTVVVEYGRQLLDLYVDRFGDAARFILFSLVGASGVLVNFLVFSLAAYAWDMEVLRAATVSFVAAATSNFLLNKTITFRVRFQGPIQSLRGYLSYVVFAAGAYVVNIGVLDWLHNRHGVHALAAQGVGIVCGMALNYVAARYLVFRHRGKA